MKQRIMILAFLTAVISTAVIVPVLAAVIYVTPEGYDGNDGLSWATAKASVQAGIDAAEPLDEVWVAAGEYYENITAEDGVAIYGGFAGTEELRKDRNTTTNVTVLDGSGKEMVVLVVGYVSALTRIDGFTIRNGINGIYIDNGSPIIANNKITNNTYGIKGKGNGRPIVESNRISNNRAGDTGAGIEAYRIVVKSNEIVDNLRGIYINASGIASTIPFSIIVNNIIKRNTYDAPGSSGGGMAIISTYPVIVANNIISNNRAARGGGVFISRSVLLCNNTITNNEATENGGAIHSYGSCVITNNIVAYNSSGIFHMTSSEGSPSLQNNCFYSNTSYDWSAVTPDSTNISSDPSFESLVDGDLHLQLTSPCINSGSNAYLGSGWLDMDGNGRIYPKGGTVDIGADEYVSDPVWSPGEAKRLEDGQQAILTARGPMSVTAAFPEIPAFYVQQSDRTSGIQCRGLGLLEPGQAAVLVGTMGTVNWERVLLDASIVPGSLSTVSAPTPLGLNNRSLGGGTLGLQEGISGASGLNNIGLLVKTTGRLVEASISTFIVDDGSGESVKVVLPTGVTTPVPDAYVAVTGISSIEDTGAGLKRLLRVRSQADVQLPH